MEEWVKNVKTERAYKMRNDFDEEKEKKLEKQFAIKNQIEELSNDNENQKLIAFFNVISTKSLFIIGLLEKVIINLFLSFN